MNISYFLIQLLISSIETGNIWHDCVFIAIILFCSTFVAKAITRLVEFIISSMDGVRWQRVTASYTFDVLIDTANYAANQLQVSHMIYRKTSPLYNVLIRCRMSILESFVGVTRTVSIFDRQCT